MKVSRLMLFSLLFYFTLFSPLFADIVTVKKTNDVLENVKTSEGEVEDKKGNRTKVIIVDFEDGTQKAYVPESIAIEKKATNWAKDKESSEAEIDEEDKKRDSYSLYIFAAWSFVWLII